MYPLKSDMKVSTQNINDGPKFMRFYRKATKASNVEDSVKLLGMPSFMAFLQNLNFTGWTLDR